MEGNHCGSSHLARFLKPYVNWSTALKFGWNFSWAIGKTQNFEAREEFF
jgi:hypothetical protein